MKYTKEKNQETILAICLGLLVIYLIFKVQVLIPIALGLIAVALFSQFLAGWITWIWLKISHIMGFVMSKVIMGIIFYGFLFPIAMLSRIFKGNSLQLKKQPDTYYVTRNHTYSSTDLENPW
jgi:hypothetical protein